MMPIKSHLTSVGFTAAQAAVICGSVNTSTAGAGTTYADATVLPVQDIFVIESGAANSGIKLPASGLSNDDSITISNYSGNGLLLYPPTGGQLNNLTATTGSLAIPNGTTVVATCLDALNFSVTTQGKPAYWS